MKKLIALLAVAAMFAGLLGCTPLKKGGETKASPTPKPVVQAPQATPTRAPTATPEPEPTPRPTPAAPVPLFYFAFPAGVTYQLDADSGSWDAGRDAASGEEWGPGHWAGFDVYPPEGQSAYTIYVRTGRFDSSARLVNWSTRRLRDTYFGDQGDVSEFTDEPAATSRYGLRTVYGITEFDSWDPPGRMLTFRSLNLIDEYTLTYFDVSVPTAVYDRAKPYIDALYESLIFGEGIPDEVYNGYASSATVLPAVAR